MSRRAYWTCQILGWSLYTGVNVAVARGAGLGARPVLALCTAATLGLGLTHACRAWIRRQGWSRLAPGALVPRVLGSAVGLSAVTNLVNMTLAVLVWHFFTLREINAGVLVFYGFNWSAVYLTWLLVYFGVHFLKRSREEELLRLQATAAAHVAELRYLKAQLNPHFLFNCLNSIRALIVESPPQAQQLVTQLASILRYSLGAGASETVALERELEVVRDYLALEGARLEERLRVSLDVPADCLAAQVPVLLVQSLVENGIKHGIARLPAGGAVGVRARRDGSTLVLEVTNTAGEGAAPTAAAAASTGVGLANATERLRLLFGDAASLQLDCSDPALTTARVRLPVRP